MTDHGVRDQWGFSDGEWSLLVGLPEAVVTAASAVENDGSRRTQAESAAGHEVISAGRESASPLVNAVAVALLHRVGDPEAGEVPPTITPADPQVAAKDAVERARIARALLGDRVDEGERGAYLHWLVSVADAVIGATRTGGVLGLGGEQVTDAERRFRDTLAAACAD
ncbi:hypothetical protein GCM10010124_17820 [Pilimelia terevasa]|uniref:Uncharacterized protein n=1 Tax=Pilimelia terevasa TaxID=53372 RepID=A0A8J3BJB1_9ACTN|nr:hypothetical protein [Pilimelia terevasa]GGK25681.1 hypothetical protein GCM10010124_17820 [Pilimelia terevasa]